MSKLELYLNVGEGLFGIRIKRNKEVVPWRSLTHEERSRIAEHLEKVLIVTKNNLTDKK